MGNYNGLECCRPYLCIFVSVMSKKIGLTPEQKIALRLLCNTCNLNQFKFAIDELMDAYVKQLPLMGVKSRRKDG